jgi:hypothetical protein
MPEPFISLPYGYFIFLQARNVSDIMEEYKKTSMGFSIPRTTTSRGGLGYFVLS